MFSECRFQALGPSIPEIRLADLQETCLDVKVHSPDTPIEDFLAGAIEPPEPDALKNAIQSLCDLDALKKDEKVTPLGKLLASLPLHPSIGRMIVLGIIFRCLDPLLMICAASSSAKLYVYPHGIEEKAITKHRSFDSGYNSDPVSFVIAFSTARRLKREDPAKYASFMRENYLSSRAHDNISLAMKQLEKVLMDEHLIPRRNDSDLDLNENSSNFALIRALSIAGYRGNVACRDTLASFRTGKGDRAYIRSRSANNIWKINEREDNLGIPEYGIVSYGSMQRSDTGMFALEDTTLMSPVAAALFASELELSLEGTTLTIDKWLRLAVKSGPGLPPSEDISITILLFREAWDNILTSAFGRLAKRQPINHVKQQAFVDALVDVVSRDLGDDDVRRLYEKVAKDAAAQAKAERRRKREERDVRRLTRLEAHVDQSYVEVSN